MGDGVGIAFQRIGQEVLLWFRRSSLLVFF